MLTAVRTMVILSVPEILLKKKDGGELSDEELQFFIDCVCNNSVDRSQVYYSYFY